MIADVRTLRVVGIVFLLSLCGLSLAWIVYGKAANEAQVGNSNVAGGIAGVLALAAVALGALHRRADGSMRGEQTSAETEELLNNLAVETLAYWRTQAKDRRVRTPAPAMVHWTWGRGNVAAPVSDFESNLLTDGIVARLRLDLYGPSKPKKLVILGEAGAGKTTAMMLLLIDILQCRAETSRDPVPIWLTLGGWDPSATPLLWRAAEALGAYPSVGGTPEHTSLAADLFRQGRVALFLDGLDEMPETMRAKALAVIDHDTEGLNVVLTCRPHEYAEAIRAHRLWGASVIELLPVGPREAATFLMAEQIGEKRADWQTVAKHIEDNPHGVLAGALSSPLSLSLAREAYAKTSPVEMLNLESAADAQEIQRHLLRQLLVVLYPEPEARRRSIPVLSVVAQEMRGSRDFRLWDFPTRLLGPRPASSLIVGALVGCAAGLSLTSLFSEVPGLKHNAGMPLGFLFVVLVGVGGGWTVTQANHHRLSESVSRDFDIFRPAARKCAVWCWTALLNCLVITDGPSRIAIRWPNKAAWVVMLRFGLNCTVLSFVPCFYMARSLLALFLALILGGTVGLVTKLVVFWRVPLGAGDVASPIHLYRRDRRDLFATWAAGATIGGVFGGTIFLLLFSSFPVSLFGSWLGSTAGGAAALLSGGSTVLEIKTGEALIGRTGKRPPYIRVLQEADDKQLLRKVGSVYQFRHAALQDLLADPEEALAIATNQKHPSST